MPFLIQHGLAQCRQVKVVVDDVNGLLSLVNIADMIIRLDIMVYVPQSAAARITNVICPMGRIVIQQRRMYAKLSCTTTMQR